MTPEEQNQETKRVFRKENFAYLQRYIAELLFARESEEPADADGEARYREMILKNSRGDTNGE